MRQFASFSALLTEEFLEMVLEYASMESGQTLIRHVCLMLS